MKSSRKFSGASHRALVFVAMVLVGSGLHAQQAFQVDDIEVCPVSAGVVDPEFSSSSSRMTYVDRERRLRVARIRADGTSLSVDCSGSVIDDDVTVSLPGVPRFNGPEWARSEIGVEIYYTRLDGNGDPQMARAYVNGGWVTEMLAGSMHRGLPIPTTNANDSQARILYVRALDDSDYELMWREVTDPASEVALPAFITEASRGSPRWVRGERAITTTLPDANGVAQAVRYDIDTRYIEVLTSGDFPKDEVWMWSAPEFDGDMVFITIVAGVQLHVYRYQQREWHLIRVLDASGFPGRSRIFSPEPHIVGNRSYVAMQLSAERRGPSDIWISSIDPAEPLLRQVSEPRGPEQIRFEPEWMTTTGGTYVFYTQGDGVDQYTLRRARTGLGIGTQVAE
jgi:hypothetical protein